jgi:HSP20 family protein
MLPLIRRKSFWPSYMPDLFDDNFFPVMSNGTSSTPAVNISENEKSYVLELAVPGINKKDLRIDINEDVLTISSEMKNEKEEDKEGYKRKEFSYSSFCRSFNIPEDANREKIEANYKDGVLIVGIPKQAEAKNKITRQISIE